MDSSLLNKIKRTIKTHRPSRVTYGKDRQLKELLFIATQVGAYDALDEINRAFSKSMDYDEDTLYSKNVFKALLHYVNDTKDTFELLGENVNSNDQELSIISKAILKERSMFLKSLYNILVDSRV